MPTSTGTEIDFITVNTIQSSQESSIDVSSTTDVMEYTAQKSFSEDETASETAPNPSPNLNSIFPYSTSP